MTYVHLSLKFCTGSYPHASQFYYVPDRGNADAAAPTEVFENEIGLEPSVSQVIVQQPIHAATTVLNSTITAIGSSVVSPFHGLNKNKNELLQSSGRRTVFGGKARVTLPVAPDTTTTTTNVTTHSTASHTHTTAHDIEAPPTVSVPVTLPVEDLLDLQATTIISSNSSSGAESVSSVSKETAAVKLFAAAAHNDEGMQFINIVNE